MSSSQNIDIIIKCRTTKDVKRAKKKAKKISNQLSSEHQPNIGQQTHNISQAIFNQPRQYPIATALPPVFVGDFAVPCLGMDKSVLAPTEYFTQSGITSETEQPLTAQCLGEEKEPISSRYECDICDITFSHNKV